MNPGRFFIPYNVRMNPTMFNPQTLSRIATTPRGMGLFGRIANGIRSIKWGSLLNNTSKTLNVVNQTIPLVRQAGPMVNNMKSMFKIAKAFGNETTKHNNFKYQNNPTINNNQINSTKINNNIEKNNLIQNNITKKEIQNNNIPNFFI